MNQFKPLFGFHHKNLLPAFLLSLWFASNSYGQKENELTAGEKQQTIAMETELERLQDEIGLPPQCLDKIRLAVAKPIAEGAKTVHEFNPFKGNGDQEGILSRELGDAIHQACIEYADPDALFQYVEQFQSSQDWADEMGRRNVIVFLDDYLELTPDQIVSIDKILADNWLRLEPDSWNGIISGTQSLQTDSRHH